MIRRCKELFRDLCAAFHARVLLRFCPVAANRLYDSLPHSWLVFLDGHGFFGQPTCSFPWLVTLTNGRRLRLEVNPAVGYSVGYAFQYKHHDVGLRRVQEHFINRMSPASVYLDIGSNIGVSSIYALSCGRVCWLFEPNVTLRPFVERLCALNGYTTARLENTALSSSMGEAEFYLSRSSFLSSFHPAHAAKEGDVTRVKVALRTLDSYLPELKTCAAQVVVKIDVEGHEMSVLKGAVETLRHYQPPVMMELLANREARAEALHFMQSLGYTCRGIVNAPVLETILLPSLEELAAFQEINFLFLPAEAAW
jgi:FkbM family methyltransferase